MMPDEHPASNYASIVRHVLMALYGRGVDAGQRIAPTVFVLAQIASGHINAVARGILGVVVQGATRKGGASDD